MPNPNGGLCSTSSNSILAHFSAHRQSEFVPKTKDRFPVFMGKWRFVLLVGNITMRQNNRIFLCKTLVRKEALLFSFFLLVFSLFVAPVYSAGYTCSTAKTYTSCKSEYYLSDGACLSCPSNCTCDGGTAQPAGRETDCPIGYTSGPTTYDSCSYDAGDICYTTCVAACSGEASCETGYTCTYDSNFKHSGIQYYGGICSAGGVCPIKTQRCTTPCTDVSNTSSTEECTTSTSITNGTRTGSGTKTCKGNYLNSACYSANGVSVCSGCSSYGSCNVTSYSTSCNTGYTAVNGTSSSSSCACTTPCTDVLNTSSVSATETCSYDCTSSVDNASAATYSGTRSYVNKCVSKYTSTDCYSAGNACSGCSKWERVDSETGPCSDGTCYVVSCNAGYSANEDNTACVGNTYKITYRANDGTDKDVVQEVTYGSSVTLKGADTFKRDGYSLNNWQQEGTSTTYTLGQIINPYTVAITDIALLAVWSVKSFTISYNLNGASGATPNNQTCTFGDASCFPATLAPTAYQKAGYLFAGWGCKLSDTGTACSKATVFPTDNIADVSNGENITLTAQWTECPVGYYCTDIATQNNCPAGATSDARSSVATQCYLLGGKTKICDGNNNCFTLPSGAGKLYYH